MIGIDLDDRRPLTDQIVDRLRYAIASGQLRPGDPLPPIRQLAGDLGIHFNTVARAYRALETKGLVRTVRGRGTRVTARRSRDTTDEATLRRAVRELFADARLAGLDRPAIERLLGDEMNRMWPDTAGRPSGRSSA